MATAEVAQPQETQQTRRGETSSAVASSSLLALHRHLVNALLKPVCPDIQVKAFNRIYSLHRIFLVQSTFFNSLLNGEFKEAKVKMGIWASQQSKGNEEEDNAVELHFDDPNITRPAFEYCLATLYGAAPSLILPSWACPSPQYPLTSHFQAGHSTPSSPMERHYSGQHPATPRFLLSLIAASTYLGIPSVGSLAVTLILCSITPYTVSHYLRFSLGEGIVGAQEAKDRSASEHSHWDWELEGPTWGLESLSKECSSTNSYSISSLVNRTDDLTVQDDEEEEGAKAGSDRSNCSEQRAKESSAESFLPSFLSEKDHVLSHQGRYYYGAQSDKIGEACSCWLLRWGVDVLLAEEQFYKEDDIEYPSYISTFTLPRNVLPVPSSSPDYQPDLTSVLSVPHPTVWCHPKLGGIPANWTRNIISSDSFWVRSEWDRFDVAQRMVAMRRGHLDKFVEADENVSGEEELEEEEEGVLAMESSMQDTSAFSPRLSSLKRSNRSNSSCKAASISSLEEGESTDNIEEEEEEEEEEDDDEDEQEYLRLFSHGIYYTHMTFKELSAISNRVCSRTHSAYVPMDVLQSALWAQSELRGMILSKDKGKPESSILGAEEEEVAAAAAAATAAEESSTSSKKTLDKTSYPERELGLVSAESDFATAYQSLQQKKTRSSLGSSRGGLLLGGMRPLMLQGGASSSRMTAMENLLEKRFFAVPSDDTVRIGENLSSLVGPAFSAEAQHSQRLQEERGGPSGIAAALFDGQTLNIPPDAKRNSISDYFGVQNAVISGRVLGERHKKLLQSKEAAATTTTTTTQRDWTGYEPMRLGVEFFGVDRLKEKERLYSPTFNYAGSVWNLYVQIIKKPKGLQLGIYLHRQNYNDALPNPSLPSDMLPDQNFTAADSDSPQTPRRREVVVGGGASLTGSSIFYTSSSPTIHSSSHYNNDNNNSITTTTTGVEREGSTPQRMMHHQQATTPSTSTRLRSSLTSPISGNHQQALTSNTISLTPSPSTNCILPPDYLDQRRVLRAYFSVHCPSPLGTSLTKFSSRPDNFTLSQSWGWKSSSLLGAVYLSENKIGSAENQVSPIFRCIVTVGVV